MNPWTITGGVVGAVVISGVAFWQGYRTGYAASEADHNAAMLKQIEDAQEREAERIDLQRERDELARQVGEQIDADPVVVYRCLGPSRGVQLNAEGVGR